MLAESAKSTGTPPEDHKASFFRQSGWMMIATVAGGIFMALVQILNKVLPNAEYSAMGTLFQVLNWMTIPGLGLQMVFAQQASAVITDQDKRQLVGTVRAVLLWTFCIWLVMAVVTVLEHQKFIDALKITNPAALWITLSIGLIMLWLPIVQGLLQGRQNFLWLGWVAIFNGVGRVLIAAFIVLVLHGWAAGIMGGVLIGLVAAVSVGGWQNRDLRHEPSAPFEKMDWLKRVVPLTLGCGSFQFIFSADLIAVQAHLGDNGMAAPYVFGGTLARAIVLFTGPLAAVMFPKLVHSAARSQKSNLMGLALLGTTALSCMAALGLTIVSPFLIKYGSKPEFISFVPLMPLFAWAMVPLAIGNILLNNLMAHSHFKIVPVLMALAAGYWIALQYFHDNFKMVIETLGAFSLLFLVVTALFTWVFGDSKKLAEEL